MSGTARPPPTGSDAARLPAFYRRRRETLVDEAIQIAKDYGYAQYTTTIRAAWTQAIDTLTDSLAGYLACGRVKAERPEAELDYQSDPRFAQMREVAKRHRAIGVTFQLYLGLFKHFRTLYIRALGELPLDAAAAAVARERVQGFFDAAELSIGADWAEATEDQRLVELQARARGVALDKDRYFAVFESLRDPAFLLDRHRRLLTANQAAAELFVGEAGAGDIVYLTSMRGRRQPLEAVLKTASRAGDGEERSVWLDTRRGPMCFDLRERAIHDALENTKLGHVVILHDVTTHRRATEEAVRARRAMSVFLATMSHEIRTPLHGVLGATELLREADSAQHPAYVDAIETAGRHLLQTLNKVLDYSRLEARPPDPTPRACRLRGVFEEYGHFASIWARRAKIPFDLSIARNLPHWAMLDWEMIQQVLTNLVSNALRHDTGGGVTIRVRRCGALSGEPTVRGPAMRVEVLDSGPGIAPADAAVLFEPFGARGPGTAATVGAGLGLAISRRLVEAMGGRIGFRNRRAGGAAFWFDLPYQRVQAEAVPVADEVDRSRSERTLRCLLVDDDRISRMVTADQLRRHGFVVTEAESAAAAARQAAQQPFDVFLVDYHLSDDDGASLVKRLRRRSGAAKGSRQKGRTTRFVALTANADLVSKADGGGHPFDALLAKPAAGEALLDAVLGRGENGLGALASPQQLIPPVGPAHALTGVSPRIVDAMAEAFTAQWDAEVVKFRGALERGDRRQLADLAHRVASSCAVMGIADLAGMLRDLETECRQAKSKLDLGAWRARLDTQLRTAPDRARAVAAAAAE